MKLNITKFEIVLIGIIFMLLVFAYKIEHNAAENCDVYVEQIQDYIDKECSCTDYNNPFSEFEWDLEAVNETT